MRIRTLVPALACLVAAPFATAAEGEPSVKFDGFVDSIWSHSQFEFGGAESGFTYEGKLGVAATITDKVSAQVDINVDVDGTVSSRQAYGTWLVNDDVALKSGKFISDYGWTGAYAPLLYRVNAGPITALYGVDQVGANAKWSKGDLAVAVTVANGFFGEDAGTGAQNPGQDNEAYAWGVDIVYKMGDKATINLELIYDEDAAVGAAAGPYDADGTHIGLNVESKPTPELMVAAELIVQSANNKGGAEDTAHTGFMALANYKLSPTMSVTGQISHLDVEENILFTINSVTPDSFTVNEIAFALLTNPVGGDKFGANFEVNYQTYSVDGSDDEYAIGLAAELLYVF